MATSKVTVTLGEKQIEEIRVLVKAGRAANVSAFVQHAVRIALSDTAGWRDMLDDALRQTGGGLTQKSGRGPMGFWGEAAGVGRGNGRRLARAGVGRGWAPCARPE